MAVADVDLAATHGKSLTELVDLLAEPSRRPHQAKLDLDPSKVNVNGGAIAIGHPIGMSGARIALHLALELNRRGGGVGAAALCGGGGQGSALILRVPA